MQHNEQASPTPVAGVDVAALKERAVIIKDTSIAALRDEAREFGRMPFKVRDMHVGALHDTIRDLLAALDALTRAQAEQQGEIARWQTCEDCGEKLERPGHCHSAAEEHRQGYETMHDELVEERDALKAEVARLTQALQQAQPSPVAEQGQE